MSIIKRYKGNINAAPIYEQYIKGLEHVSIDFKNVWSLDGKLIIQ